MKDLEELGNMVAKGIIRVVTSRHKGMEMLPDLLVGNSTTNGLGHTVGKTVVLFEEGNGIPPVENEMERKVKNE